MQVFKEDRAARRMLFSWRTAVQQLLQQRTHIPRLSYDRPWGQRAASPLALSPDLLRRRWAPIHKDSFPSVSGHPCRSAVKSPEHFSYCCVCARNRQKTDRRDRLAEVWEEGACACVRACACEVCARRPGRWKRRCWQNKPIPPKRSSSPPPAQTRCCLSSIEATCNRISFKIMSRVLKSSLRAPLLSK